MIIDFWTNKPDIDLVSIKCSELQKEQTTICTWEWAFKDKLLWSEHVDLIIDQLSPHLYCVMKLKSFKVNTNILKMFFYVCHMQYMELLYSGMG